MKKLSCVLAKGLCLYLLGAIHSVNATNYAHWDVESNTFSVNGSNQTMLFEASSKRTTETAHSGSYSIKSTPNMIGGNETWGTCATDCTFIDFPFTTFSAHPLYYRVWMRIDSGFDWGDGDQKVKASRFGKIGSPMRKYTGYIHSWGWGFNECEDVGEGDGGCLNADGSVPGDNTVWAPINMNNYADSQWHEYILKMQWNSCATCKDAQFKLYVDGNYISGVDNVRFGTVNDKFSEFWDGWMLGNQYFQGNSSYPAGGTMYFDDWSVDDTWNSLIGAAPASDSSSGTGGGGGGATPPVTSGTGTGGDTTPPVISSVASTNVSQANASITATTNEPADFQVEYGVTTSYGQSTALDTTLVTNHAQTLSGLTGNTTYHYRVKSRDASGNLATSGDKTFTTLSSSVTSIGSSDECTNWETVHPEWIWCDDFESANISAGQGGYLEYDNNGGNFVPISGVGWNNSYGMRAKWQAGDVNAGSLSLVFGRNPMGNRGIRNTEDFRELYYRAYVRTQSGWTGDPGKFMRSTVFSASDWTQAMIAHLWSPDSGGGTLAIDPVSCVSGSNVVCSGYNDFNNMTWLGLKNGTTQLFSTANSNKWYCVESHVKLNDPGKSNGIEEFWVNGQREASSSNLNFVGSYTAYGLNAVFLENFWNAGSPQAQERYLDNFVVSTKPIGCNPLSGLAAPLPPSNIK